VIGVVLRVCLAREEDNVPLVVQLHAERDVEELDGVFVVISRPSWR
jgi:hypothetical protein